MVLVVGALFTVAAVVFLICFIVSIYYLKNDVLKVAVIAIILTGTGF